MDIPARFQAEFASVSPEEMKETLATVKSLLDLHRPVDFIEAKLANAGWSPGIAKWMVQQVVNFGGVPPLPSAPQLQHGSPVPATVPTAPITSTGNQLKSRYADSYRLAAFTNRIGLVVRWVAILLAGIYAIGLSSLTLNDSTPGSYRVLAIGAILLAAGISGLLGYCLGILISTFGKMLSASLDTAVYACPEPDDDERVALALIDN